MTIGEFEERIAPMKEKYPFTDKETGIKLLEKSNKTYYIDDINYNSLTRYFMVSFNYKFNTFGKGNAPQGRGHRMGHGGRPPRM